MTVRYAPASAVTIRFTSQALAIGAYTDNSEGIPPKRHFQPDGQLYEGLRISFEGMEPVYVIEIGNVRYSVPKAAIEVQETGVETTVETDSAGSTSATVSKLQLLSKGPWFWVGVAVGLWAAGKYIFKFKWL